MCWVDAVCKKKNMFDIQAVHASAPLRKNAKSEFEVQALRFLSVFFFLIIYGWQNQNQDQPVDGTRSASARDNFAQTIGDFKLCNRTAFALNRNYAINMHLSHFSVPLSGSGPADCRLTRLWIDPIDRHEKNTLFANFYDFMELCAVLQRLCWRRRFKTLQTVNSLASCTLDRIKKS